ncbi:MAG: PKD domain-containing protein [Candidatus Bipolaricaulis sp.]|nr:PKD domain-containing protein [Candidatus Bipolaricaulis sp.]
MNNGLLTILLLAAAVVVGVFLLTPAPPEASFEIHPTQTAYDAPATLTFTDTSVARGGALARWEWDFGDGSPVVSGRNPGPHTFRVTTSEPKDFTISLTVWNAGGRSSKAQRTVTVYPAPKPVINNVVADPPLESLTNIHAPIVVTLEAFAEQEKRPHVSVESDDCYVWVLTSMTPPIQQDRRVGKKVTFTLLHGGEYNLVLTVTNTGGTSETWSHKLVLLPPQRAVIQNFTLSSLSGIYPMTTTAAFTATHPNAALLGSERLKLKYEVDWGDGTTRSAADALPGREVRVEKTYTKPGQYTVTVRVFSDLLPEGTVASETKTVNVKYHVHYMMPAWSPDFRKIAFVYRDDSRPAFYEIRLATLQAEQSGREPWRFLGEMFSETTLFKRAAAAQATNIMPSWSPAADKVVIMSDVDGQRSTDLYVVGDRDTSSRLTRLGDSTAAMPVWMPSPYQKYILFTSDRDHTDTREQYILPGIGESIPDQRPPEIVLQGIYEIYKLDTTSGGISRLTYSTYSHRWPTVSPDGTRIAFEMRNSIYTATLAAADSDVTLLVGSPFTDTCPRWNPHFPHLIAFMRYRQDRWEVWVYDLNARTETPVSPEETVDVLYPSWSPDGRFLVCQRKDPAGWRLVVYEVADGNGQLRRGAVFNLVASP